MRSKPKRILVQRPKDETSPRFQKFLKAVKETAEHFEIPEDAVVLVDSIDRRRFLIGISHLEGETYYHTLEF